MCNPEGKKRKYGNVYQEVGEFWPKKIIEVPTNSQQIKLDRERENVDFLSESADIWDWDWVLFRCWSIILFQPGPYLFSHPAAPINRPTRRM